LRFQLGRAYRLKGDLEAARAQFSEAIRMRNGYLPARYELAEIGLLEKRPAAALEQANAILAANPNDRRARLIYARSLLASGDAVRAHTELTQLIKDAPKDVEARLELGSLAFQQRKYHEAIETLSELRDNGDPRVFAGLVASYARLGQIDKAVEVANEGLKRSPDSTVIREQLAESATLGGKFDLAISEFQKLIALNSKSVETHLRLGTVYLLKVDYANAIPQFQQAHSLAPTDLGPALTLAEALSQAGRKDDANAAYKAILRTHPNDATALNNTAYFLCDSGGDLNEALKLAQSAVQKVPDQPGFEDTLGYVYLKKGQRDSAIQTFSSLVLKHPHYATYRYHLGMALYENGDKLRAKKELRDALAEHPSVKDTARIKELLARAG
jgi:tetratricopeptide (TPR) repeat protein